MIIVLASGRTKDYNSGFNGKLFCPTCADNGAEVTEGINLPTDERFYDKYDYSVSSAPYSRGFLGDASKEMGPFQTMQFGTLSRQVGSWYSDEAWPVESGNQWVNRGGGYNRGIEAGIFGLNCGGGHTYSDISFRLVLAF